LVNSAGPLRNRVLLDPAAILRPPTTPRSTLQRSTTVESAGPKLASENGQERNMVLVWTTWSLVILGVWLVAKLLLLALREFQWFRRQQS
jgi:hypothetical protein